jgi:hypothetical protein
MVHFKVDEAQLVTVNKSDLRHLIGVIVLYEPEQTL